LLFEQTRRDLAVKTAMLEEVHHRVKNNLSAVIGILAMEALNKKPRSARRALHASIERIRSIATVHNLLAEERLGEVNFHSLARATVENLQENWATQTKRVRFVLTGSELVLPPKQATPLALLLNELAVNALKHAFPNGQGGTITISAWERDATVTLEVKDNGVGLPEGFSLPKHRGLGMQIIEGIVKGSLGGQFILSGDYGTTATVTFPKRLLTSPPVESSRASGSQHSQARQP
jgi:two-component sensor histidine kinase